MPGRRLCRGRWAWWQSTPQSSSQGRSQAAGATTVRVLAKIRRSFTICSAVIGGAASTTRLIAASLSSSRVGSLTSPPGGQGSTRRAAAPLRAARTGQGRRRCAQRARAAHPPGGSPQTGRRLSRGPGRPRTRRGCRRRRDGADRNTAPGSTCTWPGTSRAGRGRRPPARGSRPWTGRRDSQVLLQQVALPLAVSTWAGPGEPYAGSGGDSEAFPAVGAYLVAERGFVGQRAFAAAAAGIPRLLPRGRVGGGVEEVEEVHQKSPSAT